MASLKMLPPGKACIGRATSAELPPPAETGRGDSSGEAGFGGCGADALLRWPICSQWAC